MQKIYGTLFLFLIAFCGLSAQNTVGLLQYDGTKAYDGYNLFYPHFQNNTYLLDNCGRVVNTWGDTIYNPGNSVVLLENGNIVRACGRGPASNQWMHAGGGGELLEIRDWDNNLLWQWVLSDSLRRLHHDFAVKPNGNILAIVWEYKSVAEAVAAGRDTNYVGGQDVWPDMIIEVEPVGTDSGNIVWEWHSWDHLVQDFDSTKPNYGVVSQHPELININYDDFVGVPEDWHHANAIDYNASLAQVIISIPAFDEVWIIDQSTTTSQAAGHTGGIGGRGGDLLYRWGNPMAYDMGDSTDQQLFYQHDIHWIDQQLSPGDDPDFGKLMIYNNQVGGNYSSVVIIDPAYDMYSNIYPYNMGYMPASPEWEYTAPTPTDMFSSGLSGAQRLKNGNTLICVGRFGRSFEITPAEEVVWEYVTPFDRGVVVTQGDTSLGMNDNLTFRMNRYGSDFAGFAGKDLTPGDPIELNPDTTCSIVLNRAKPMEAVGLNLYPNPASGAQFFVLEHEAGRTLGFLMTDLMGREVLRGEARNGKNIIDLMNLKNGVYLVKMETGESRKLVVAR